MERNDFSAELESELPHLYRYARSLAQARAILAPLTG